MRKTRQKRRHMLANYAFSFPVYIHHRAHISFLRIFPSALEKSPTVFSENRRKKWGILRIFSETPPEGICHGVILRNLIHSFVYFLFLSLSAPFPAISPGHPRHLHVLCSFIQDRLLLRSHIKKSCDQHGIFCRIKTRPDAVCTTHDVFFLYYSIVVLP